jgi:hypothetical protein
MMSFSTTNPGVGCPNSSNFSTKQNHCESGQTARKNLHRFYFATIIVLLAVAFCVPAPGDDSNSTRNVSGHEIVHYKNGPVPVDLSAVPIAAYVPTGSSYNVITGAGTSTGTFTIPGVPKGFYLLQFGSSYLWTSNTMVDLDFNENYRSTGVAANSSTQITFDLTNLNAWQSTDAFEIVCPNNAAFESTDDYLYGAGTPGETAFTGTYPYVGNLSDASLKDQYYTEDLVTQEVGGYPFPALAGYYAPPKFTQAQGSDISIDGNFKTIPQTNAFEANINGADLAAQAVAANPNATLTNTGIALDVHPGSLAKGDSTSTPDLILYEGFDGGAPLITSNGDLGPVSYGNPYPASWPLFVGYTYYAATNVLAPGATNNAQVLTYVETITTNLPSTTSPLTTIVGVVQNPSISGTSFFTNQSGVGLTPLLQWSAPSVGTATYYQVTVDQLTNNSGNTEYATIATLSTQQTSLQIPTGVLTSGQAYVFIVTATYVSGLNFARTPYFYGPTTAWAQVLSGVIQP